MTQNALALSPRAVGAPDALVSLSEEEMLHTAGGFAMLGGVLLTGCLITGAVLAVAAVAVVAGAVAYIVMT
jgi:hypothetical protein